MKNNKFKIIAGDYQKGQILLISLLVLVVALTVGLSVVTRSITTVRTTSEEESSQRAFSAAEAGIEQALVSNTSPQESQTRENFVTNPSFEGPDSSFFSWGTAGNTSGLTYNLQDSTYALDRTHAAKFQSNLNYTGQYYLNSSNAFTPIVGHTYTFSASVYIPAGSPIGTINIAFRNWTTWSDYAKTIANVNAAQWTRISVTYTAQVGDSLRFTVADPYGTNGVTASWWVDGLLIEDSGILGSYFDGATPGASWTGTPDASSSLLVNSPSNPIFTGAFPNSSSYATSTNVVSGDEFLVNGGGLVLKDDPVDVWLSEYPDYTNPWPPVGGPGTLTVYWVSNSDSDPNNCANNAENSSAPAIEIVLIKGDSKVDPNTTITHYAFDPCNTQRRSGASFSNNFTPALGGGTVKGKAFTYSASITVPTGKGLLARIIPLYAGTHIGVIGTGLPPQGTVISSIGSSGGTQRKIVTFRGYPRAPIELYPFLIFSTK
jgi:hypothetical protein